MRKRFPLQNSGSKKKWRLEIRFFKSRAASHRRYRNEGRGGGCKIPEKENSDGIILERAQPEVFFFFYTELMTFLWDF